MAATLLAFLGASFLLAMAPGPTTALLLRQVLRTGRRATVLTIAGSQVGLLGWSIAAACGLSALLAASETVYTALRIGGALVLLALGVQSLRGRAEPTMSGEPPGKAAGWRAFRLGLVTEAANPKAAVFALAFLPGFVPAGAPVLPTILLLGVLWVAVDTAWYVGLTALAHRARARLLQSGLRRRLEQTSGLVLIAIGASLALERR
ncbi:MAG: LysE family translocator [Candidatus Limnocylindrales bacterium]